MSDKHNDNLDIDEEISLESILAEYKGEAFIEGRKKTPNLDEVTDQILEETLGGIKRSAPKAKPEAKAAPARKPAQRPPAQKAPEQRPPAPKPPVQKPPVQKTPVQQQPVQQPPEQKPPAQPDRAAGQEKAEGPKPEPPQSPETGEDEPRFDLGGHETWADQVPEPQETQAATPKEPIKLEPGKVIQIPISPRRREEADREPGEAREEPAAPPGAVRPDLPEEPEPEEDKPQKRVRRLRRPKPVAETQVFEPVDTEITDSDPEVTDYPEYANRDDVEDHSGLYDIPEEDEPEEKGLLSGLLGRLGRRTDEDEDQDSAPEEIPPEEEGEYDEEDLLGDDMPLSQAAGLYGKGLNGYHMRGIAACALSLLMLLFTVLFEGGRSLPGIMGTAAGMAQLLLLAQLIVMFLGYEVIATGVTDAMRLRLSVETLITVAALASALDAVMIIRAGEAARGLSYAPVVSFSIGCAIFGIKMARDAMKVTLRTAATGASPYVVTSKYGAIDEGYVLFKSRESTEGFLRKTQQMDFGEYIYTMAAPMLLIMAAVFALLAALGGSGEIGDFLHNFSAMTAVSATFTGLLAYGMPYSWLAKKLMKAGAALAGWGGACEVDSAAGVVVTDFDVFPAGTLSLSGVRVFKKSDTQRVISYTGSVIAASGSGLTEVFTEVIRQQKYSFYPVEDLACYEGGGIGAMVNGEEVMVGSASFMNLIGVRLPQELNVKTAVYTAMRGELVGVFAINYVPISSVQEALVSLLGIKIQPLFAMRDFNITPLMLQQKFKISTEIMEFLSYEERYALSSLTADERARPFAVLCREGLGPLTDVVVGGKRLRRSVTWNIILSLASSVIGLVLMLSFFWSGSTAASVGNVFFYMLAWLVVSIVLSRSVTHD